MILDIESLELHRGEKIGLVGRNGAGKSTLLSVLSRESEPDDGVIAINGASAVIHQDNRLENLAAPGMPRRGGIFSHMEMSRRPSGGELTRNAITAALASSPDVLFADEPTTNLDIEGIEALSRELMSFTGAMILVSHDRTLLDELCGEIWEIEDSRVRIFPGNYSAWMEQKTRERDFAAFKYDEYRREKHRLEDAARKINDRSGKPLRAQSRMGASEARVNPGKGKSAQAAVSAGARAIKKRARMLERRERPADLPDIKKSGHTRERWTIIWNTPCRRDKAPPVKRTASSSFR
ncbi:MAG: ATP-binding cassette domain-containing protein [Synergistaceae bacterium]|nr:ATP-binding cassette domain-containing protein [Synergistaceae bacterium]